MSQMEAIEVRSRVLGVLLREAREAAGKTERDLSRAMGCAPSHIRDYEMGRKALTLPELELAAYYLEVPMAHFLSEEPIALQRRQLQDPEGVIAVRQRIIGSLLRQARVTAQKSLREVARGAGITAKMLRAYEFGERSIPVPVLESLALELAVDLDYFRDETASDMASWDRDQMIIRQFQELPEEVRKFVLSSVNRGYLEVAVHLSQMPADRLRLIAEGLLDITY